MVPTRWGPASEEWVIHIDYPADDPRRWARTACAIHDAQNPSWKVAAVLGGDAGPDLLETYEPMDLVGSHVGPFGTKRTGLPL